MAPRFWNRRSERDRDEAELRLIELLERTERERSDLAKVAASISEGFLLLDENGRGAIANPAFCRIFGIVEGVEGRTVDELTGDKGLELAADRVRVSGEGQYLEIVRPSDSASTGTPPRTLACSCAPLTDSSGAVITARDITDSLLLGQIRRDLVANVSHEIKTPLTAIRGFAETLRDGALDDRKTAGRFTDRILQQCSRLQALLSDLLTLSRLESGEAPEERQAVDLDEIVRDAVETLQPAAAEKQVEIEARLDSVRLAEGDPQALTELSMNLLDNAIKYNRTGGRVGVRLAATGNEALFEVTDTGRGIPEKALGRIFERFYRVDRGRSRAEGGTGLGLAIAKHAAEIHGGRIEVESELGSGSRFRVFLPLAS